MAVAAHQTTVDTVGASTVFTAEAFSVLSGNTWQIDDTSKRIWDPDTALTFRDSGAVDITSDVVSKDYLLGTVTFGSSHTPGDGTGAYLPAVTVAEAREFTINLTKDLPDTTVFGDTVRKRTTALGDANGSIGSLDDTSDALFGSTSLSDLWENGTPFVLSIRPGGGGDYIRLWALFPGVDLGASVDDLVNATLSFELAGRTASDGTFIGVSRGT